MLDFAFAFAYVYVYVYLWHEVCTLYRVRICTKNDPICSVFCTGDFVHLLDLTMLCYPGSPDNRNKVLMVVYIDCSWVMNWGLTCYELCSF